MCEALGSIPTALVLGGRGANLLSLINCHGMLSVDTDNVKHPMAFSHEAWTCANTIQLFHSYTYPCQRHPCLRITRIHTGKFTYRTLSELKTKQNQTTLLTVTMGFYSADWQLQAWLIGTSLSQKWWYAIFTDSKTTKIHLGSCMCNKPEEQRYSYLCGDVGDEMRSSTQHERQGAVSLSSWAR